MNRWVARSILVISFSAGLGMPSAESRALAATSGDEDAVRVLAEEVANLGWVLYSARGEQGDWDICCCRPNGTDVRNLTRTPQSHEFSPQVSRDGSRLLYRRLPRSATIDNNRHGEQGELIVADSDGSHPQAMGKSEAYPWGSWSPDGRQIVCLSIKGIFFVDVATRKELRRLPRKGFFQQLTWSPDGKWLCGVANSFGASWSIARMNATNGEAAALHKIDCCTPDWFPDSQQVIFSWRPPGQKSNPGYGWTQLWRTDAEGKSPKLIYGEDGRHVYGGQVSPDGKYALFTGNMEEDGDPGHAGAPMGLLRLSDAPLVGGESQELRALHPQAKHGPVLVLPAGWEPCWTSSELPARQDAVVPTLDVNAPAEGGDVSQLTAELHDRGWIVFSARNVRADWDLFQMRPDGSDRQQITDTQAFNEAGARFSRDGQKLLYYRLPLVEPIDNNTYGTFDLVLANRDGREAVVWGRDYPWASWGPDGQQLACLTLQGIQIRDVATRSLIRQLPRHGIVSQLVWAPDGTALLGTANGLGPFWNIGRLEVATGVWQAVSETDRYNCTSDWCPDSRRAVYARGIVPERGGRAELWSAAADGTDQKMLYADGTRHIYGGCSAPDGKYLVFTRSVEDLGQVDHARTTLAVIRWSDGPMVEEDNSGALRADYPDAGSGPRLDLGPGWEPDWTQAGVETP